MSLATSLVLSLSMLQAAPAAAPPSQNVNPVLMKVNGEPIYAAEVSMLLQQMGPAMGVQPGSAPNEEMINQAAQQLVQQKLLAQEARRQDIEPNAPRIDAFMDQMAQQAGGREALDASLKQGGLSVDSMRGMIEEMDLARQLVGEKIPAGIEVTDTELKEYHDANPEAFVEPPTVRTRHILFTVAQDADEAAVEAARSKAEAARARALEGEDFADLAKELSQGPSASRGGDIGFAPADRLDAAYAEAAFALKVGEISKVVRSSFGFHVIKAEEKKEGGERSLDEASEQLRQFLKGQKAQQQVAELLKSLTEAADIDMVAAEEPTTP